MVKPLRPYGGGLIGERNLIGRKNDNAVSQYGRNPVCSLIRGVWLLLAASEKHQTSRPVARRGTSGDYPSQMLKLGNGETVTQYVRYPVYSLIDVEELVIAGAENKRSRMPIANGRLNISRNAPRIVISRRLAGVMARALYFCMITGARGCDAYNALNLTF